MTFGTYRWWGCQPHAPAAFTPRRCSWYSFSLGAESTPGSWYVRKEYITEKSSDTTGNWSRDRPTIVAQRLNHSAPTYIQCIKYINPLNVRHPPSMCSTFKAFVRPLWDNRSERYCVVGLSGQTELSFHDHDNQDPLWCFHLNYPEVCISACLTCTKMREWKYQRKNDSLNGTNLKRRFSNYSWFILCVLCFLVVHCRDDWLAVDT